MNFYFRLKFLLIFFGINSIFNFAYSQNSTIDSLKWQIKIAKHDTTRINLYQSLFYSYKNISLDSSYCYVTKSLNLSRSLKFERGIASAIGQLSEYYLFTNDYKKAAYYCNKAISYYKNLHKELEIGIVLGRLGLIRYNEGNDFESAKYYLKAISILEKYGDKYSLAKVYTNLGNIYNQQEQYIKAIENHNKALELFDKLNNQEKKAIVYVNIANVFSDQRQNDSALKYYLKALPNISNKLQLSTLYYDMGESYLEKGNFIKSENNYLLSLHLGEQLKNQEQIELIFEGLLRLYGKWKKYKKAEFYIQKILANLKQIENRKIKLKIYDVVQSYYFGINNIKEAYRYIHLFHLLNDSVFSESSNNRLTEMEVKYETKQKEKELLMLKVEQKEKELELSKNKYIIYGLFFAIISIIMIMYFFYRNYKQKQSIREFEKNAFKQKLLLTQMNPHFIFNSIDNIQGLIHKKQDEQAITYLDGFSKLTRQILENSRETYITLSEEINMIENYLNIQQLLHNHSFLYTIDIAENINQDNILLPPMLTQPFIENSIKHGLNGKFENGQINLSFFLNNNKLFAEITDNGSGFNDKVKNTSHKSLAMNITKERLEHYSKGQDHSIRMENILDSNQQIIGAKVLVEIPYIYEK